MKRRSKGFTLLEAIVALTILSMSLSALYSWYSVSLMGLIRSEEKLKVVEFMHEVDAYLVTLNLTGESTGEFTSNKMQARWQAQLLEPQTDGKNAGGQMGYYRFGLYAVDVEVFSIETGALLDQFTTRLVGYEGVRVPALSEEFSR